MLFEEKKEGMQINKPFNKTKVRIDLEPEREYNLQVIRKVYSKEIKKISRTKLLKMAIDNLINDVEEQTSEEERIEY